MPVLDNPRHELFAQGVAKGQSQREAYKAAGYETTTDDTTDQAASRLSRDVKVESRIADLLREAAIATGVTIQAVSAELSKIGFANMQDYMSAREDGEPFLDFSALTREQAAALSEVSIENTKRKSGDDDEISSRLVKFKLHDKRAALVDLGKFLGMFKERHEVSGPNGSAIQVEDATPIEKARLIAFALAKAQKATTAD